MQIESQTFVTLATATAFFQDHVYELGPLGSGGTFPISISLNLTASAPGDGFGFGFDTAAVPEPGSATLLMLGAFAFLGKRKRPAR